MIGTAPSAENDRRRPRLREAGAAAVEFALVIPLFLTIVFGAFVLGVATFDRSAISHAAREAARWATVHGSNSRTPASASDVQAYVEGMAPGLRPLTVTTTWTPSNAPGGIVRIDVRYDLTLSLPFVPPDTFHLRTSAEGVIAR